MSEFRTHEDDTLAAALDEVREAANELAETLIAAIVPARCLYNRIKYTTRMMRETKTHEDIDTG